MTYYAALRRKCEFSRNEFGRFKRRIDIELLKPNNRIGLGGIDRTDNYGKGWDIRLDLFIGGGIGNQYWGPGTERIWSFPAERTKISAFLNEAVRYFANLLKLRKIGKERVEANQRAAATRRGKEELKTTQTIPNIGSSSGITNATKPLVSPSASQLSDLVLLTSLIGSNRYKFIHGTDVPALAHLVESIGKAYMLNQDQKIVRICVKIDERLCNVDLDESRDWRVISWLIIENGGSAEMAVEIT